MRERREGKKGESFCVVVVRTEKEEEECWVFATWPYRLILGFGFCFIFFLILPRSAKG